MTDDRLERALSDAITDLAGTSTPDYLDDILERTSRTRQRPWWTFPRRYFVMTPTLKFVAAASLAFVLGIGIAPLIAPSNDGAESPAAAETPSTGPAPSVGPVEFTARLSSSSIAEGKMTFENGAVQVRGAEHRATVADASDPRLLGSVTLGFNEDRWMSLGPLVVANQAFRIENEDGAWQQIPSIRLSHNDGSTAVQTIVLEGEDAYDGLSAIAEVTFDGGGWNLRGVIIDTQVPPPPEQAALD